MHKRLISSINADASQEQHEQWLQAHLALFSSSLIFKICAPKGIGQGGISYIRKKVGEKITGMQEKDEDILTESIAWGNMNQPYAVKQIQKLYPKKEIREQMFIVDLANNCCSTLDVATITEETATEIKIIPTEIKCPQTYDKYIELFECDTPEDVKQVRSDVYWQLLDQCLISGAIEGKLFVYNPLFKGCSYKEIPFKQVENMKPTQMHEDLKFLKKRKSEALTMFNEIYKKLKK